MQNSLFWEPQALAKKWLGVQSSRSVLPPNNGACSAETQKGEVGQYARALFEAIRTLSGSGERKDYPASIKHTMRFAFQQGALTLTWIVSKKRGAFQFLGVRYSKQQGASVDLFHCVKKTGKRSNIQICSCGPDGSCDEGWADFVMEMADPVRLDQRRMAVNLMSNATNLENV